MAKLLIIIVYPLTHFLLSKLGLNAINCNGNVVVIEIKTNKP